MAELDSYESLVALMRERRSVRRFADAPLPEGTVDRLIEAARWAPSASNRQAFRFLTIESPEVRAHMAQVVRQSLRETVERVPEGQRTTLLNYAENFVLFESAPLVIVAYHRAGNPLAERLGLPAERDVGALSSVSAAIMNLLLAAHALGLGACWMTGPLFAASALESYLKIPAGWNLSAVVPVGRPAETPAVPNRRAVSQLVSSFGGAP